MNYVIRASSKIKAYLFCHPFKTLLRIFSQLFEVYDTLPDPSLGQMVEIVKGAVNLCSGIYICVGFFGYIAFYSVDFGGNNDYHIVLERKTVVDPTVKSNTRHLF